MITEDIFRSRVKKELALDTIVKSAMKSTTSRQTHLNVRVIRHTNTSKPTQAEEKSSNRTRPRWYAESKSHPGQTAAEARELERIRRRQVHDWYERNPEAAEERRTQPSTSFPPHQSYPIAPLQPPEDSPIRRHSSISRIHRHILSGDPLYAYVPRDPYRFLTADEVDINYDDWYTIYQDYLLEERELQERYGFIVEDATPDDIQDYLQYRAHGGRGPYRSTDTGDEPVYQLYPKSNSIQDNLTWQYDFCHLPPTIERLRCSIYRDSHRDWYYTLRHPPASLQELIQAWHVDFPPTEPLIRRSPDQAHSSRANDGDRRSRQATSWTNTPCVISPPGSLPPTGSFSCRCPPGTCHWAN